MSDWTFSRVVSLGKYLHCTFHICVTEQILLPVPITQRPVVIKRDHVCETTLKDENAVC